MNFKQKMTTKRIIRYFVVLIWLIWGVRDLIEISNLRIIYAIQRLPSKNYILTLPVFH